MEITALKCDHCSQVIYPPRQFCPNCRKTSFSSVVLPREGTIFSHTTIHYPLERYPNPPYYIGLVLVNEVHIMIIARVETEEPSEIIIGKKVELDLKTFPESGEVPIIVATIKS